VDAFLFDVRVWDRDVRASMSESSCVMEDDVLLVATLVVRMTMCSSLNGDEAEVSSAELSTSLISSSTYWGGSMYVLRCWWRRPLSIDVRERFDCRLFAPVALRRGRRAGRASSGMSG
jgi:hypothetical protein